MLLKYYFTQLHSTVSKYLNVSLVVAAAVAPQTVSWTQWENVIWVIVWVWLWRSPLPQMHPETHAPTASLSLLSTPPLYHRSVTVNNSCLTMSVSAHIPLWGLPSPPTVFIIWCLLCNRFSVMLFKLQWCVGGIGSFILTDVGVFLQRIVSPETDSGFGSSYLNQSASGPFQPNLLTERYPSISTATIKYFHTYHRGVTWE